MEEIPAKFIDVIAQAFTFAVIARMLMSWVRVDPYHPLVRLLHDFTEPILGPIRNMMPRVGMFDFSPIIAILLVDIVSTLLKSVFGRLSF